MIKLKRLNNIEEVSMGQALYVRATCMITNHLVKVECIDHDNIYCTDLIDNTTVVKSRLKDFMDDFDVHEVLS